MLRLTGLGVLIVFPTLLVAAGNAPLLATMQYQPQVQGWVQTHSADVTVAVNASVSQAQVASRKQQVVARLQSLIAKKQWHITRFTQTKDSSGLTKLSLIAVARLPQRETTTLTQKLNKLNRSGEQYRIASMSFSPSLQEVQRAKQKLRQRLYDNVQREVVMLNKTYKLHYYPSQINFSSTDFRPAPVVSYAAMANVATSRLAANSDSQSAAVAPAVASRLTLKANVTLAARAND